jgi:hypothetical protein
MHNENAYSCSEDSESEGFKPEEKKEDSKKDETYILW